MADYTKRPIKTTARKDEVCAETGKTIRKGQSCWLNVKTRKFYAINTKTAQKFAEFPNAVHE